MRRFYDDYVGMKIKDPTPLVSVYRNRVMISLQSDVVWTIVFVVALLAWLSVIVFIARALYRVGARRNATKWWISVWGAIVLLVLLPLIGLLPALVALIIDADDRKRDPAGG